MIAKTFDPPYVMAVFTSIRTVVEEGYDQMNALTNWKENILHKKAHALGKEKWYKQYKLRIGTVNRDYNFKRDAYE